MALLLIPLWLATGCGQTFVLRVPDAPAMPWSRKKPSKPAARAPAPPLSECPFMSVMIDYSREGNTEVGARVASAMTKEFESLGTHVTRSSNEAYWSLMILASENSRKDGYVFSAMLSARNMTEGYDPGVPVFQRDGENAAKDAHTQRIPTLYSGLSYGPYASLEEQARGYVRHAYAAVYPFAQKLCAFDASDRKREQSIEEQLPGDASPL